MKRLLPFIILILSSPLSAQITKGWEYEKTICEGDWHVPWYYLYPYLAYNLREDGKWVIISGREAYGGYFGFYLDTLERRWVYDESLTEELSAHGWEEAPALCYNLRGDNKWVLIGHQGSSFYGYYWDGDEWIEDPSIVNGLPEISGEIKHCFIDSLLPDGRWTLITGTEEGILRAFYWDGDEWIEDPSRVNGIPDIGSHVSVTAGFNLRGDNRWVLIVTNYSVAQPRGFYWDGDEWIEDSSIVKGLPEDNLLRPTMGYNVWGDGKWILYMGCNRQGTILGYFYDSVDVSDLPQQEDIEVSDVGATTALIKFTYPRTWTHSIKYSLSPDLSNPLWSYRVEDEDSVEIKLKNLLPDTTYYFRVYTFVPWDTSYYVASRTRSFRTLKAQSYIYLTPDDTLTIQDALELLPPEGGTIELSSGTFSISEPIRIWMNNVTIFGQGMDSTVLMPGAQFDGHLIFVTQAEDPYYRANWIYTHKDLTFWFNYPEIPLDTTILVHDVTLRDFKIDGNGTNGGIYGVEVWDVVCERIRTEKTTGAISYNPGINCLIDSCISLNDRVAYWLTLLSRSCYIKNCTVKNAHGWIPAVHTNGSKDSEYEELPDYPPPEISNNIITDCVDAIHVYSTNDILVHDNIIDGFLRYGIKVSISGNCEIYNNIVKNGRSDIDDSHGIRYHEANGCIFRNNIVYNNKGYGFHMADRFEEARTGEIINNVFYKNSKGGLYNPKEFEQDIIVKNNIIAENGGWGIEGGFSIISYNDVWGNDSGSFYNATPDIGNIFADPLFADPENGDFHLKSEGGRWDGEKWVYDSLTSPCIDAGDPEDDYSNEPEPNGDRINMGAYGNTPEASKSYFIGEVKKVIIYPNPYRADMGWEEKIIFDNLPSGARIWIYTLTGELVKETEVKGKRWEWNLDNIPTGVYIYLIKATGFKNKGKLAIIK